MLISRHVLIKFSHRLGCLSFSFPLAPKMVLWGKYSYPLGEQQGSKKLICQRMLLLVFCNSCNQMFAWKLGIKEPHMQQNYYVE